MRDYGRLGLLPSLLLPWGAPDSNPGAYRLQCRCRPSHPGSLCRRTTKLTRGPARSAAHGMSVLNAGLGVKMKEFGIRLLRSRYLQRPHLAPASGGGKSGHTLSGAMMRVISWTMRTDS